MGFSAYRDAQISLHNHSEYSNLRLLDSTNKAENMIDYVANTLGQQGFALTDHECLSGHIKYLNTVKEMKAKGKIPETFKPILGNEIYLVGEEDLKYKLENKERINFYIKFQPYISIIKYLISIIILCEFISCLLIILEYIIIKR